MLKKSDRFSTSPSIRRKAIQMNKEMIMETAASLFAEGSFEGTSLDDIASKIGATKGLIYHYFPSKGVLLGELLLWIHGLFVDSVEPAYKKVHSTPLEKFKSVIRAHIEFNYKYMHMISIIYRTLDSVPPNMRRKIRKLRLAYLSRFIALVEEVQESGKLVKGDSLELAVTLTTLLNYLPYHMRDVDISKRETVYDLILRLMCR